MDTAEAIGAEMPQGVGGGNLAFASLTADKLSQQMLTDRKKKKQKEEGCSDLR